jgi:lysophospholipase L1-like esterase
MRAFPAALAVVAFLISATAAGAATKPTYLAIGDSVSFGYRESNVATPPPPDYTKPASFVGFPELLGESAHLKVVNAACPGETSASLVNAKAQSNGCEDAYRKNFPLHVRYTGSELSFATKYLKQHPKTRLVTLMVGANDLFLCQKQTSDSCLGAAEQKAVFARIASNVRKTFSGLRRKGHYRGQIVLVRYYNLDYTSDIFVKVIRAMNKAEVAAAKGFHVTVADGYTEFQRGSASAGGKPCDAGLLNRLDNGSCGVHPSRSGQALLAKAVQRVVHR